MNNILSKDSSNLLLLDAIMEHCVNLITVKNLNYEYLACNKAFLSHLGFTEKSQIIGKNIFEVLSEDTSKAVRKSLDMAVSSLQSQTYVFNIMINNEQHVIKQVSTPIINNGNVEAILSISSDITEDELLKNEILEKNSQLNTLLEYIPTLVYMKDKNKNYLIGSKYAKDFVESGYDPHANNIQIDMEKAQEMTDEEDDYVLSSKKLLVKEKLAFDNNGEKHWYRIYKAPIVGSDLDIKGLVTIAKNIDSVVNLQNQKDLFIATLIHDLKNPLLAQISALDLFSKGSFGILTAEQKEILDIVLESANYMKTMMYSTLNAYKYDNGNVRLAKNLVDVEKLIQTCANEHMCVAKERNIEILIDSTLSNGTKFINVDENQIRRVLSNLFNNGLQYAFPGTKFCILLNSFEDYLKMSFENCSPEIDEETKLHIFEKYVSGTNQYQKVSFGLGMYLTKKIIEAHQGRIYLEAEGTQNKFIIELPYNISTELENNNLFW